MKQLSERQKELFKTIDEHASPGHWRDWKWQLRHAIHDIETVENLLGIEFEPHDIIIGKIRSFA